VTPTLDAMIAHWREREAAYDAQGLTNMAQTARRYREALERLRTLERSP